MTALLQEVVIPEDSERLLHGNASVTPNYFERTLEKAIEKGVGIAFMHSHPVPGWQDMSGDDIRTEQAMAAQVKSVTGLPLLGMTIGTDEAWSARFWEKVAPRRYQRSWCQSVRIIGEQGLNITFNARLVPPPEFREELKRTISCWGIEKQQQLARLRVGVVGLGSVGSIVAEALARLGIQHVVLLDFDLVEKHNLDRLVHAQKSDYLERNLKVSVAARALKKSAAAKDFTVVEVPYSVTEEQGFKYALDCDLLFSCVDRPWGRYVLNIIAYAHLIPVIDGGIAVTTKQNGVLQGADWQAHIAIPTRRCLACLEQYDPAYIEVERKGFLDDPTYIRTLPRDHTLRLNENVFPFSLNLASLEVLQMLSLVITPLGISDVGTQNFHFVSGTMDVQSSCVCEGYCRFPSIIAMGDACDINAIGDHPKAKAIRQSRAHLKRGFRSTLLNIFRRRK